MKYLYRITYSFTAGTDDSTFKGNGIASYLLDHKLDNMSTFEEVDDSLHDKILQEYNKMCRWKKKPDLSITYSDFKLLLELKDEEN